MPSASASSGTLTAGNSSDPESARKHLKPSTPASWSGASPPRFRGMTPPQKPMSTWQRPSAASRLARNAATLTVAGTLSSGMSTRVVIPPVASALPAPLRAEGGDDGQAAPAFVLVVGVAGFQVEGAVVPHLNDQGGLAGQQAEDDRRAVGKHDRGVGGVRH